ncbi:MAG: VWA domain-containing protein, partial [Planctomycetales bacterium]|nr:VWA domain-containing protein [Planctomycetales bacterium]
ILGVDEFQTTQNAQATQVEIDIALVIDRSGSMAYSATEVADGSAPPAAAPFGWDFGDHVPPNSRWLDTVNAVNVFIGELNASPTTERVSLSTYEAHSTVDLNFTTNYSSVLTKLDVYTQNFNGGATNVAAGIDSGASTFNNAAARPWASKVLIVLTDGIQTVPGSPVTSANNAGSDGIMIHTVTFSDEADQTAMTNVAAATNGKHYHASTGADLSTVFREIAASLPTLLTK